MAPLDTEDVDPVAPQGTGEGGSPPRRRRRPRPIFLMVGVVIAVGLGIGLFTGIGTPSNSQRPVVGASVPTFSLSRLGTSGSGTSGTSGKVGVPADGGGAGKPAVLLFFASWCGPCQQEVPAIASTYRRQQVEGSPLSRVALIGVDDLDPKPNALAFVHKSGVSFPVAADVSSTVTNGLFQLTGLPDAVFVDANGTIGGIHVGPLTSSELVSWEHKLLRTR